MTRIHIHTEADRKFPVTDFDKPTPDPEPAGMNEEAFACDWTRKCQVCDGTPVVNATGLCGPCTFGEADTAGGNW